MLDSNGIKVRRVLIVREPTAEQLNDHGITAAEYVHALKLAEYPSAAQVDYFNADVIVGPNQVAESAAYVPEEDDAYIRPCGQLGARTSASYAGRHLGEYDDDETAVAAIRAAMDRDSFWPNIWNVSDHGNVNLYQD